MFKKLSAAMLAIPMLFMFAGGMGAVSAEDGYHKEETELIYACESVTNFDMPVTITAEVPDSVEPGEEFSLKDSGTEVTLPEDVVGTISGLLKGEYLDGEATKFQLFSENEEGEVNVAKDPIPIPETDVPDSGTMSFKVPGEGGVDAGPFVAGENGEVIIKPGNIDTDLVIYNPASPEGAGIEASCAPVEEDTVLHEIPIEEQVGDTTPPEITLNGDAEMELEVGESYDEPGATAEDNEDGDVSDDINISGDVNTDEPGEYEITYTVLDEAGNEAEATRTVTVVEADGEDTTPPEITLNGEAEMELEVGESYDEPGATAEDNEDGDVSDDINISGDVNTDEPGEYEITYTVSDEAGNEAEATRTVTVVEADGEDTTAPEIALNGEAEMELEVGESYDEPGATAEDDVDGDVSDKIDISGDVNTEEPGEYEVTYTVSDASGNESTTTRTVTVVEADEDEPGDGDNGEGSGGKWFSEEGKPDADLGNKADLYLNETNYDIYKKDEDGWALVGNLKDEADEDGTALLTGEGEPNEDKGEFGDLYLDKDSMDVYFNSEEAGKWQHVANLESPQDTEDPESDDPKEDNEDDNGDDSNGTVSGGDDSDNGGGTLPTTATNSPLFMLFGTLMTIAGGAVVFIRKKMMA